MRARVESSAWSLVVFTVFAQAAAGAALMRVVLPLLFPSRITLLVRPLQPVGASREAIAGTLDPLGLIALGLLGVAACAALIHLTRPRAARFALSHVGASWLSREILLGALFGIVLVIDLLLRWFGVGTPEILGVASWIAAGLALAFVHSIVQVYRIRTVPTWNTPATPIAFFGTTVLLGVATAAVVFATAGAESRPADQSLRSLGLMAAGVVVVELGSLFHHLTTLKTRGGAAAQGARAVLRERRGLLALRSFCAGFGALLLLAGTETEAGTRTPVAVLVACGLLLLSELIGRTLFYASHRRVGL